MPPPYAKGHKRHPQKDHLMQLDARKRRSVLPPHMMIAGDQLPAQFDARQQGWIGPVKNQGQCGSCWDYSGTGVTEVAYYKPGVLKPDGSDALSEQYTLDCGRNGGCSGDDNVTVLEWAKKTGLPKTSDYGAYQGHAARCSFKQSMTLYKIDDWGFADNGQGQGVTDPQLIKAAIFTYGCVGCGIAADNAFMNASAGQIFDRTTSQEIDHDIILVGWGDASTKVTSSGPNAMSTVAASGWWWLRNSWGDWCDKGYCQIGWGVNLVGSESVWAHINAQAPPIDWYS